MKVGELKDILKNSISESDWYNQNWTEDQLKKNEEEVVIVIKEPIPTLGALPIMKIESAGFGFDWDSGRLLLHPKEELIRYKKVDSTPALCMAFIKEIAQQRTAKGKPTKLAQKAQQLLNLDKND